MRYRVLAAFPLVWGVLFLVGVAFYAGSPSYTTFLLAQTMAAKLLALVGAWVAAFAYRRGEYPRRAWFLIGASMALLLLRELVALPVFAGPDERRLGVLVGVLIGAGNLAQVAGVWLLARAWKVADLSLQGSWRAQAGVVVAAVVLAGAIAGPSVLVNTPRVLSGELTALPALASALGDMVSLALIAPLLLTALALRGGLIGWPWALITASYVMWLVHDGTLVYGPAAGLADGSVRVLGELTRAVACTYGFSAGLAQRGVVVDLLRLGRSDRAGAEARRPK